MGEDWDDTCTFSVCPYNDSDKADKEECKSFLPQSERNYAESKPRR